MYCSGNMRPLASRRTLLAHNKSASHHPGARLYQGEKATGFVVVNLII